jgi:hypothetical protein
MAKKVVIYGKDRFGKQYGFKVSEAAYPADVLTGLGWTKLAANTAIPADTILASRNRASQYFGRVRLILENGKNVYRFIASPTAANIKALVGKTVSSSKIISIKD